MSGRWRYAGGESSGTEDQTSKPCEQRSGVIVSGETGYKSPLFKSTIYMHIQNTANFITVSNRVELYARLSINYVSSSKQFLRAIPRILSSKNKLIPLSCSQYYEGVKYFKFSQSAGKQRVLIFLTKRNRIIKQTPVHHKPLLLMNTG